jgi:hypothetical protein
MTGARPLKKAEAHSDETERVITFLALFFTQKLEILWGNCNAHARRRFVQVTPNFPQEC